MIFTYPDLHKVLFRYVGSYSGDSDAVGEFRRVAAGFVWEFRWPTPRQNLEVALLGDGSFVLLEQNPQVHWHKVIDCQIEPELLKVVYQSEWIEDLHVVLELRSDRELEYRKEFRSQCFKFVLQRIASPSSRMP